MNHVRSTCLFSVVALVGVVVWSSGGGPGISLPQSAEIDRAGLASVRDIQGRLPAELHQWSAWLQPGASLPEAPGGDREGDDSEDGTSSPFPGRRTYIVTLENQLRPRLQGFAEGTGGDVVHLYDDALTGFSVELVPQAADALRRVDQVVSVEEDQPVEADAQTTPTGVDRVADPDVASPTIPNLGIDGVDAPRVDAGVAILDTGVAIHPDLNVAGQVDCTQRGCTSGGTDRTGHGTHVAGIAAAIDNDYGVVGVAPGARIHSVKVLGDDGRGYFSDVIAGIDWATARAGTIDVINMSLSGAGTLSSLDRAIDNAVDAGIAVVVAAGNDGGGEDDVIPANHPDVLAVSALADSDGVSGGRGGYCGGFDDRLAVFSNFGRNVDVIAPGTCIRSTVPGGYGTMSGTSMAAAHVAGAAALLAANGRSVASIRSTILGEGNLDWVDTSGDGRKEPLADVSGPAFTVSGVPTPTTTSTSTTSTSTTSTSTTSTSTSTSTSTTSTTVAPTTTTTAPSSGNQTPTATFDYECRRLGCLLDGGGSSDSDGDIQSYDWNFGDGSVGSGSTVRHVYRSSGTFSVMLTVVDDDGARATATRTLSCTSAGSRVTCR